MRKRLAVLLAMAIALSVPVWADGGGSDDKGGGDGGGDGKSGGSTTAPAPATGVGAVDDKRAHSDDDHAEHQACPAPGNARAPQERNRHLLGATAAGQTIDASGRWETRARGTRQRLKVEIEANVPDGTTFLVLVNNQLAGAITVQSGEGELELDNEDGQTLPAGVDPVASINMVQVVDSNDAVVLQGGI